MKWLESGLALVVALTITDILLSVFDAGLENIELKMLSVLLSSDIVAMACSIQDFHASIFGLDSSSDSMALLILKLFSIAFMFDYKIYYFPRIFL